ncbi:hypothetical protein V1523DRAFT_416125 [Lipomyces doorenjongii]
MHSSRSPSSIEMVAAESATMAFLKAASPASDLPDDCASLPRSESPLDTADASSLATSLSSTSSSSSSLPKMATFTVAPQPRKKMPPKARRAIETTCPLRGCSPLPIKGPRSALRHFESPHHREMFEKLFDSAESYAATIADNSTASSNDFECVDANSTCIIHEHNSATSSNLANCRDLHYFYNDEHYKYVVWIAETGYHHEFAKTHRNGVHDLIAFDALVTNSICSPSDSSNEPNLA